MQNQIIRFYKPANSNPHTTTLAGGCLGTQGLELLISRSFNSFRWPNKIGWMHAENCHTKDQTRGTTALMWCI